MKSRLPQAWCCQEYQRNRSPTSLRFASAMTLLINRRVIKKVRIQTREDIIIATIAIPSLLRSRQAANESAAVANLRTVNTAEVTYLSSAGGNYGSIPELITAGLLDSRFSGTVSGYTFTVTAAGSDYTAGALPTSANSGRYGYTSMPDAVVRYSTATTGCGGPGGNCYPTGQSGQPVQ